jgi:hypothetical protein
MKTLKLLLLICALCFSFVKTAFSLNQVSTFTLANPCAPQVTLTPIPNTYGCYSITANNGAPNDPDAYYQWQFQDGTNGVGKTIYHCCSPVTVTTNYTISLTYNSPQLCGPLPNVQVFTLTLSPPPSTLCVYNTASYSLAANSVTVWAGVAIPEIFTNYIYGDGSPTTTAYTHTYATCGNYIVTVHQWNMNTPNDTCHAYAAININCASPNGIKNNYYETTTTFYPIPAKEVLTINTATSINEIKIYDVLGKEIFSHPDIHNIEKKINLQEFLPGTYFAKIRFEDGHEVYKKLIKE